MSKTHLRPPKTAQIPVTVKPKSAAPAPEVVVEPTIPVSTATPISELTQDSEVALDTSTDNELLGEPTAPSAEAAVQGHDEAGDEEDEEDEEAADLSLLEDNPKSNKVKSVDATDEDEKLGGILEVFRAECLQCKHLVPFAKKKLSECHFSKGNKACPAASVQVIIRVPLEQIVPRWMKYEREGDYAGVARMAAKLSEKPEHYQQRVKVALEDARAAYARR